LIHGYEVTSNIITTGDRLYSLQKKNPELQPQLAKELPKVSKDGLKYTIPLREGITFHDGTPFTEG